MKAEYIDQYGIDSLPNLKAASASGLDSFITTNRSVLEDREELEETFGVRIFTPSEAVKEFGGAEE